MLKRLLINDIEDQYVQENFIRLQDYVKQLDLGTANFTFFTITVPGAVTNFKFAHNLGYVPLDIIQTSLTGAGAITWNYNSFTKEFLDLTTTGALVVRGFVGRFDSEVKL